MPKAYIPLFLLPDIRKKKKKDMPEKEKRQSEETKQASEQDTYITDTGIIR